VKAGRKAANQVRIIGGTHRGRRLSFPDLPGLRPTGDRVRETLFNWLQPLLPGARCLDLFAGSGALGLEAASRQAGAVVMLDQAPQVIQQLRRHVSELGLEQVRIEQANALDWLAGAADESFDIVFLDPPFGGGLLESCCQHLEAGGWLRPGARVYIEMDLMESLPKLPENWHVVREKKAGQVAYYLIVR
jgi:16S rRNA (guanine966-N2)-methyltransferase